MIEKSLIEELRALNPFSLWKNRSRKHEEESPIRRPEKDSPFLLEIDREYWLGECDCLPNGEEWLDRHEPQRRRNR